MHFAFHSGRQRLGTEEITGRLSTLRSEVNETAFFLPLPYLPEEKVLSPAVSRPVLQRLRAKQKVESRVNDGIFATNFLWGKGGGEFVERGQAPAVQESLRGNIYEKVLANVPPADRPSPKAAASELLGKGSSYADEELSSTVGSYQRDLVSLGPVGSQPNSMLPVVKGKARENLVGFCFHNLRTEEELKTLKEDYGEASTYEDPAFGDLAVCEQFISDLFVRGLIKFTKVSKAQIACFFVKKKDGRLRLVCDCRNTNRLMGLPLGGGLVGGNDLRRLAVPRGKTLHMSCSDLENHFYTLALPEELRPFFCLKPATGRFLHELSVREVDGSEVLADDLIFPSFTAVPMGWPWAMYFAQEVHNEVVSEALGEACLVKDRRPLPRPSSTSVIAHAYCDNLMILGLDADRVLKARISVGRVARSYGFSVHEETGALTSADSLGVHLHNKGGATVELTERRRWRMDAALEYVLSLERISGRRLERLLGHCVFGALVRPEALSVFRAGYDFLWAHYWGESVVWEGVKNELRAFNCLLPLLRWNLDRPFSDSVFAVDASESGFGICEKKIKAQEVQGVCDWNELWRFRWNHSSNEGPRNRALRKLDLLEDPEEIENTFSSSSGDPAPARLGPSSSFAHTGDWEPEQEFPEVPAELVRGQGWQTLFSGRFHNVEAIHLLEARAFIWVAKRVLGSRRLWGQHHLVLSDNLGNVLAFSRHRALDYKLLVSVRRLAAVALVIDCTFHPRWIPSEANPSDSASRALEPKEGVWRGGSFSNRPSGQSTKDVRHGGPRGSPGGVGHNNRSWTRGHADSPGSADTSGPSVATAGRQRQSGGGTSASDGEGGARAEASPAGSPPAGGTWTLSEASKGESGSVGDEGDLSKDEGGLRAEARRVLGVHRAIPIRVRCARSGGRGSQRLLRHEVPGGLRSIERGEALGGVDEQVPGVRPEREVPAPRGLASDPGLEESGPRGEPVTLPARAHGWRLRGPPLPGGTRRGSESRDQLLHLLPSGGDRRHAAGGSPCTGAHSWLPDGVPGGSPFRAGGSHQGGRVRRLCAVGHPGDGVAHRGPPGSRSRPRASAEALCGVSAKSGEGGETCLRLDRARGRRDVPNEARRSGLRSSLPAPVDVGAEEAWTLGAGSERPAPRARGPLARDRGEGISADPGLLPALSRVLGPAVPREHRATSASSHAGVRHHEFFGRDVGLRKDLQKRGMGVVSWGLAAFLAESGIAERRRRRLFQEMSAGVVNSVSLRLPSYTFTVIRGYGPGAPRVRSRLFPEGLPNLCSEQAEMVVRGNMFAKVALNLIWAALLRGVQGFASASYGSFIWRLPEWRALCAHHEIEELVFDQCQFGARWRKRTKIIFWGMRVPKHLSKICAGSRGLCSCTGRPHKYTKTLGSEQPRSSFPNKLNIELARAFLGPCPTRPLALFP